MSDMDAVSTGHSRRRVLIAATSGLAAAVTAPFLVYPALAAPAPDGPSTSGGYRVVETGPGNYYLARVR